MNMTPQESVELLSTIDSEKFSTKEKEAIAKAVDVLNLYETLQDVYKKLDSISFAIASFDHLINRESCPVQPVDLSDVEIEIRKNLRLLRKKSGIKQEAMGKLLSEYLGREKPISNGQVYNFECGKNHITLPAFIAWCKACGANPGEVLNHIVAEYEGK